MSDSAGGPKQGLTRMRPLLRRLLRVRERGLEQLLFCGLLRVQERRLLRRLERRLERAQKRGPLKMEDPNPLQVPERLEEPVPVQGPLDGPGRGQERALKPSLKQGEDRLLLPVLEPDLLNARHRVLLRGEASPRRRCGSRVIGSSERRIRNLHSGAIGFA